MGYSEDEFVMFVIFAAIGFFSWQKYFLKLRNHAHTVNLFKNVLVFLPFAAAAFLFLILKSFASFDVKNSVLYLVFYIVLGAAWVGCLHNMLPWFGARFQEDVLERNNPAALWAFGGVLLAATACFAGGNIGDGPGWWVVLFSGGLSTGSLFLFVFVVSL